MHRIILSPPNKKYIIFYTIESLRNVFIKNHNAVLNKNNIVINLTRLSANSSTLQTKYTMSVGNSQNLYTAMTVTSANIGGRTAAKASEIRDVPNRGLSFKKHTDPQTTGGVVLIKSDLKV